MATPGSRLSSPLPLCRLFLYLFFCTFFNFFFIIFYNHGTPFRGSSSSSSVDEIFFFSLVKVVRCMASSHGFPSSQAAACQVIAATWKLVFVLWYWNVQISRI